MRLVSLQEQQIDTVEINYRTYLSDAEIAEIEHEASILEYRESAGIEALKVVQKHRGWVSDDSLYAIADLLQMSVAQLEGVATFYNLIYRQPVGQFVIHICDSISCYLTGFDQILASLTEELAISFGQTTEDGVFTLLSNACLGGCDKGPVMMIANMHYDQLTPEKVKAIITELRIEAKSDAGRPDTGNDDE